ncbi:MAG: VTT domain-containing protein [Alphaproteobacteria bacterium]|nr:VTT domain-containing protein [Alphaproteobacteria bacterium]
MSNFEMILSNLQEWGYWVVFIGSIFEGEIILISSSAAAALGYLDIYKIFVIASFTTVIVDNILFFIGYKFGIDWIVKKFPKLEPAKDKAFKFLNKMDMFFIFMFRFIYGIRTISPLIIGSAHIKPIRFFVCNIFSGLLWASLGCFIGYSISGLIVSDAFSTTPVLLTITLIFILIIVVSWFFMRKKL